MPDTETKRRLSYHINQGPLSKFTTGAETGPETQDEENANFTALSESDTNELPEGFNDKSKKNEVKKEPKTSTSTTSDDNKWNLDMIELKIYM